MALLSAKNVDDGMLSVLKFHSLLTRDEVQMFDNLQRIPQ